VAKHPRRGWRRLRIWTLTLALMTGGAGGWWAYQIHQLASPNHFRHVRAISRSENPAPSRKKDPLVEIVPVTALPGTLNIALIGSDARPGEHLSHSDTIVIVHADLNSHAYSMLSLPRDARIYFPGYGYTKLTTVQFINQSKYGVKQGIEKTMATLSDFTGIPIHFYAETSFSGLESMVNAVGGVTVNLPFPIKISHPLHKQMKGTVFAKGRHFLNGAQTIEVVRERDSVPGGDYGRQQIQQKVILGIARKALQRKQWDRVPALAQALPHFLIATNLSAQDIFSLALNVGKDFHPETQLHYYQIPSTNCFVYDDVLHQRNAELVLNRQKLREVVKESFNEPPARSDRPSSRPDAR